MAGTADTLEALGVKIDVEPAKQAAILEHVGISFLFAQQYHPSMKNVAGVRRQLGIQNRGTPLRGAEGYGRDGVVRLRFADGTSVLARGDGRGGLGFAAVAVLRGSAVLLKDVRNDGAHVHALLVWDRRHHVEIDVLGSDQPD